MPPGDDQSDEHARRFDELQDRMLQAGWTAGHGHTDDGAAAAELLATGADFVAAIKAAERDLGPLSGSDKILLWNWAAQLSEIPPDRR